MWNRAISLRNGRSSTPRAARNSSRAPTTHSVIAGLGAAIELLQEVGPAQIAERILALTQALEREIAPAGFEFLSPEEENNRSGILTFRHPKIPTDRFFDALLKNNAVVSLRFDRERSQLAAG